MDKSPDTAPREAEQRVAAYIAGQGKNVLTMPLSDIARACGVSDATVVRFCQHEGFRGLKDYKIALANASGVSAGDPAVTGAEPIPELKRRMFDGCMEALRQTCGLLRPEELERAVRAIAAAGDLDVYASGGSVPVASYLRHQLIKLGVRTSVYSDRNSMMLSQSRLGKQDAVLAISSSGATRDVVDAQASARRAGAAAICITAEPASPLARQSDILLLAVGGRFLGSNTYSRLAQLAVVDVLYAGLAGALVK